MELTKLKSTETSHKPRFHTYITFPIINIPHHIGTFITMNESTLTHHCHPNIQTPVYVRVYS